MILKNHVDIERLIKGEPYIEIEDLPACYYGLFEIKEENVTIYIYIDSYCLAKVGLHKDKLLTTSLQRFCERNNCRDNILTINKIKPWLISRDLELIYYGSTAEENPHHYWGSLFDYLWCVTLVGTDTMVIKWPNRDLPIVYMHLDPKTFINLQSITDPKARVAELLGYDDFNLLKSDIKKLTNKELVLQYG